MGRLFGVEVSVQRRCICTSGIPPHLGRQSPPGHSRPGPARPRREAAEWKAQYARNLHHTARTDLDTLLFEMAESAKLQAAPITGNLGDLRVLMGALRAVREREAEFELRLGPVEAMYRPGVLPVLFQLPVVAPKSSCCYSAGLEMDPPFPPSLSACSDGPFKVN